MKKIVVSFLTLALTPVFSLGAVNTKTVEYKVGDKTFKGFLAYDDSTTDKRPGVLVVHEFWGLDSYAKRRAEQLAKLGYVAFAADMYGDGKATEHPKEAAAMAGEVRKNDKEWLARAEAGLKVLSDNPLVDSKKLAAIGYCFGGSTALKLANAGANIVAAVSFHGALPVPGDDELKGVKTKILICHGALDTFIPEKTIQDVRAAYDKAGVDYQMVYFGGAVHGFTVAEADSKGMKGLAYNAAADHRSWAMMQALFDEAFAKRK